jgi:hypothetical protein
MVSGKIDATLAKELARISTGGKTQGNTLFAAKLRSAMLALPGASQGANTTTAFSSLSMPSLKIEFPPIVGSLVNKETLVAGDKEQGIAESRETASAEDKFQKAFSIVMKHEGSKLVRKDGERGSSKYGVLETTARHYGYKGKIENISKEAVEAIYRKIWDESGAADLPESLAIVHFDTYVNSPAAARKMLAASKGEIGTYLASRTRRYERLAAAKPEVFARYLKGWKNRIANLKVAVKTAETAKV